MSQRRQTKPRVNKRTRQEAEGSGKEKDEPSPQSEAAGLAQGNQTVQASDCEASCDLLSDASCFLI